MLHHENCIYTQVEILWNYCLHNAIHVMQPDFLRGTLLIAELQLRRRQPKKTHCWRRHGCYIFRRIKKLQEKLKPVMHGAANEDSHCQQKTFALQEHAWLSLANDSYDVFPAMRGSVESPRWGNVVLQHFRSYMLASSSLETLNLSNSLRIHDNKPKFWAVYLKLQKNGREARECLRREASSASLIRFMHRTIPVMNWVSNAFDTFILIAQKKLSGIPGKWQLWRQDGKILTASW